MCTVLYRIGIQSYMSHIPFVNNFILPPPFVIEYIFTFFRILNFVSVLTN